MFHELITDKAKYTNYPRNLKFFHHKLLQLLLRDLIITVVPNFCMHNVSFPQMHVYVHTNNRNTFFDNFFKVLLGSVEAECNIDHYDYISFDFGNFVQLRGGNCKASVPRRLALVVPKPSFVVQVLLDAACFDDAVESCKHYGYALHYYQPLSHQRTRACPHHSQPHYYLGPIH